MFDLKKVVGEAPEAVKNTAGKAGGALGSAVSKAGGAFESVVARAADSVPEAVQVAAGKAGGALGSATEMVAGAAGKAKDTVVSGASDIAVGVGSVAGRSLDEGLEAAIRSYNLAFNDLSDAGVGLYQGRLRTVDVLEVIEVLVNSIANTPKSLVADIAEVTTERASFDSANKIVAGELRRAKEIASGSGAGVAAGAAVAAMAPTAALWVATTFGTASTGTAISALSGAAATQAALAWLGGGALAAGGGGVAAGNALLALAGPVGWTIAGASVFAGVALFASNKVRANKQKQEEITSVKKNTEALSETAHVVRSMLEKTERLRRALFSAYCEAMSLYGADYRRLSGEDRARLGALVNNAKAAAALLSTMVDGQGE